MEKNFNPDRCQLEGRNALLEALKSGRDIEKIYVRRGNTDGTLKKIIAMATEAGIVVQKIPSERMDEIAQTKNHQGIIAVVSAHNYSDISDMFELAKSRGEDVFLIILDGITDTHNLGAIIRSAEAAGAHGIIIPKRRSAGLNAVVAKTSSGALEYMPVARVVNIVRTIEELQEKGVWVVCADMGGEPVYKADLKGPVALLIGAEGEGVSRLAKERSDFVVSLPMKGKISSLNASVAAGILMYEVLKTRLED
ncbi:MAG: 23S rRNA (guanosine(2251)-2'-O)-methyltransferase RlmB [Firmicutes bacterium]|nr:23S rRNA (guanosine(2251)-2'-O)-methyltransferase RlmB [Bacillota bacterium]